MTIPPDFKAIHTRANEIVQNDPILAYAVSTALRKHLVGKTPDTAKYELLTTLAYSTWNHFLDIQKLSDDPKYTVRLLNLVSDTAIIAHDILTERYAPHATPTHSPGK